MSSLARIGSETFAAVAFDLDGTIYFGDTPAPGAHELVAWLESSGATVIFFTNNSVKTRAAVVDKLTRMDLPASAGNTYTSGAAVGGYLRERGRRRVALVGSDGLAAELAAAGIEVVPGEGAEALVVGLVPGFDFDTPPALLARLAPDVPIVAANMDMTYPVEGGELRPGCGAIVRAVEGWTGRCAEAVVGKPGTYMLDLLCREHGLSRREILVVGDSVDSDIAMAEHAGCRSVLIDSAGETASFGDTVVVRGLPELLALLSGQDRNA